jgi:anti-sigma B factor antagonist
MTVATRIFHDFCILDVDGEVDISSASQLHEYIAAAVTLRPQTLIMNLSRATYCDTTGLAEIILVARDLARYGGQLRLVAGDGQVKRLLDLTNLSRRYPTFAVLDDAIR